MQRGDLADEHGDHVLPLPGVECCGHGALREIEQPSSDVGLAIGHIRFPLLLPSPAPPGGGTSPFDGRPVPPTALPIIYKFHIFYSVSIPAAQMQKSPACARRKFGETNSCTAFE